MEAKCLYPVGGGVCAHRAVGRGLCWGLLGGPPMGWGQGLPGVHVQWAVLGPSMRSLGGMRSGVARVLVAGSGGLSSRATLWGMAWWEHTALLPAPRPPH